MARQSIRHTALFTLALALLGCQSVPQPGSLAALQNRAESEAMESCLKTGMTTNRHVPLLMLVDMCERTVFGQATRRAVIGSR